VVDVGQQGFEKVQAVLVQPGGGQVALGRGRLVVDGGGLEFTSKKGTLPMRPVRSLETVGAGVRVEFGEGRDLRTVVVSDWSKGIFGVKSRTRAMGETLRAALRVEGLSETEATMKGRTEQAVAEVAMKRARIRMWVLGVIVVAGTLATIITYASASDGGGTYFVFWGAMLFGTLGFLEALFEYRKHRKTLGGPGAAGPGAPAPRTSSTAEPPKAAPDVEQLERDRDIDGLVAALWRDELDTRVKVMAALGRMKDPRSVDLLVAALDDKRWDRRWSAAEALGKLEDRRAVEPLRGVLSDENALVVAAAEESIRTLEAQPG
jgi:HEAT repeats